MHFKFVRSVSIVLGIAAIMLIAPTVCAASMPDTGMAMDASAAGSCQQMGEPHSMAVPVDGTVSHCALVNGTAELVKPQRVALQENVILPPSLAEFDTAEASAPHLSILASDTFKIPLPAPPEPHSRSSTLSEEPPL
jgi:hypothetical protein